MEETLLFGIQQCQSFLILWTLTFLAAATLFRLDTFCSSCISTALRIVGRDAVLYELSPVLQQLRRDKPTSVDVETFVAALRKLTPHLPYLLGAVLFRVGSAVQKQFPDELNCAKRAVRLAIFLFIRLNRINMFYLQI